MIITPDVIVRRRSASPLLDAEGRAGSTFMGIYEMDCRRVAFPSNKFRCICGDIRELLLLPLPLDSAEDDGDSKNALGA